MFFFSGIVRTFTLMTRALWKIYQYEWNIAHVEKKHCCFCIEKFYDISNMNLFTSSICENSDGALFILTSLYILFLGIETLFSISIPENRKHYRPWWNAVLCGISFGSSILQRYLFRISGPQRVSILYADGNVHPSFYEVCKVCCMYICIWEGHLLAWNFIFYIHPWKLETLQTLMKCCIMLHFIWVFNFAKVPV